MKIGGFLPFSLSEFPGEMAAVVFCQGCNWACPFCHNASLIRTDVDPGGLVPEAEVKQTLLCRRGQLDGIVVGGGEPTLQPDLPEFLGVARLMGLHTLIETNGCRPDALRSLLQDRLLDFIAMDIKAPFRTYGSLTGGHAPIEELTESIAIIARSGLPHEFRTTVVRPLLSDRDINEIQRMIPSGSPHRLQTFRPKNTLDPALRNVADGCSLSTSPTAHQGQSQ